MSLELEVQFQLVISSVIFAMIVMNIYTFISLFKCFLKWGLTIGYFVLATCVYYFLIYKISDGVLSIYLPFCLILGYYLHMRYYDKYFSCLYEYLFSKISSIIRNVKGRCKRLWIGRSLKKTRRKENLTE